MYSSNQALVGAYNKGRKAYLDGKPLSACPYADRRTYRGGITWSRSFRIAWYDGWREEEKQDGSEI